MPERQDGVVTILQSLMAFVAAATLLVITPGLDTAMVLRSAASGGARHGVVAVLGIALGCLVWGAAVALGLGVLLTASEAVYTAVKWAGALYLMWLGVNLLVRPRSAVVVADDGAGAGGTGMAATLRRGFLSNLLNPKMGVFYVTFLPQFVPLGVNVAAFSFLLACVHVVLGMIWFGVLIAATVPLGRVLRRPVVVRRLDRVTGLVFLSFGLKLALSRGR